MFPLLVSMSKVTVMVVKEAILTEVSAGGALGDTVIAELMMAPSKLAFKVTSPKIGEVKSIVTALVPTVTVSPKDCVLGEKVTTGVARLMLPAASLGTMVMVALAPASTPSSPVMVDLAWTTGPALITTLTPENTTRPPASTWRVYAPDSVKVTSTSWVETPAVGLRLALAAIEVVPLVKVRSKMTSLLATKFS